ncbi:aspartate-semialdehyde dehydrogenase, partial [candidate division KSB1 bacterium]|nr:aspartate-semialdehyde dehydrogenase [candidate division KSB1 bacterium]
MTKIHSAVLGATGVVGQYFLQLLRLHPYFELTAVCAGDARIGQPLRDVRPLTRDGIPEDFHHLRFSAMTAEALQRAGVRFVFSALPAGVAAEIEQQCAESGIHVFSNAGAFRMADDVPILIPEVNAPHLDLIHTQLKKRSGFIVTNANCTTTGLAMALQPISALGIKKVIIASYQAVSGAGYPGLSAMDIMGNVIPHIQGEEDKVIRECVKIFGHCDGTSIRPVAWEVYAHCVRVPTLIGHLISVHVELQEKGEAEKIEALFEQATAPKTTQGLPTAPDRPIILTGDVTRPQPDRDIHAGEPRRAAGMAVVVGKLQVRGPVVRFTTLSNNLIRGAAGGSVLNAE